MCLPTSSPKDGALVGVANCQKWRLIVIADVYSAHTSEKPIGMRPHMRAQITIALLVDDMCVDVDAHAARTFLGRQAMVRVSYWATVASGAPVRSARPCCRG